jgi:gephyrin
VALITGSLKETPFAMTSRLTAGIRRSTLIVNFPGSPKACRESYAILKPVLNHCVSQLRGDVKEVHAEHEKMSAPQIVISLKSKVEPAVPAALRDRVSPYQMIDVDQAMEHIIREAGGISPSTELVPMTQLKNLIGRALAVDLKSNVNIPPFQASVKDGYAVQAVDGAGVRKVMTAPSTAGTLPNKLALTSGYCIRISTGAPLPIGADAVVQVEDTQLLSTTENGDESEIMINTKPVFGQDIRVVGADVRRGDVILKEGCVLTPVELGLIASVGFKEVPVVRPPTVGILSTGSCSIFLVIFC